MLVLTQSIYGQVIAPFNSGPAATTLVIRILLRSDLGSVWTSTIMIEIVMLGMNSASLVPNNNAIKIRQDQQEAERNAN